MTGLRAVRQAAIVCRKELRDSLRDRRALLSILFSVMVGPVLIGFMMNRIIDRQREAENVVIPIVGMNRAPALVDWLRQQAGVKVEEGPADAERAVKDRREAVVVVIPEKFAERFADSKPATVRVVTDGSRNDTRAQGERVRRLLAAYAAEIGGLRLIVRGVSPAAVRPLAIEDVEVSTAQQRAAQILTFIPMFIMVAGFVGGMQIATDSTAGERERGSLEPLLVNPAPRASLVTGKWLAASVAAIGSAIVTTALCAQLTRLLPLEDMGVSLRLGPDYFGYVLLAAVPLCLFTAALQATVATMSRSFKEAQSYMGVLMLGPMLPGLVASLYPIGSTLWLNGVPMLGSFLLLSDTLSGRPPRAAEFLTSAVVSFALTVGLLRVTTRLFRSEHIIFGR